jgi:hypothetical protein
LCSRRLHGGVEFKKFPVSIICVPEAMDDYVGAGRVRAVVCRAVVLQYVCLGLIISMIHDTRLAHCRVI